MQDKCHDFQDKYHDFKQQANFWENFKLKNQVQRYKSY